MIIRRSFLQSVGAMFLGKKVVSEEEIAERVYQDLSKGVYFITDGERENISGLNPYYKEINGRYSYYVNVECGLITKGVGSPVEEKLSKESAEYILTLVASK